MAERKVTVLARFKAKEGMEEQLKQAIMACVAPTRAEAGCINYDLHQLADDKGKLVLYENWRSKKDLEVHLEMPYLKELKAKAGELCSEPIEITLWEMVSKPV
ncbi:putative quinol monooxygenase [Desulfuromonas sp. TF]|jgi:quinol monooxygenase YgiN|uniref:putative quinol monooxygenase n=1 Tax=Desulfuromonas sp. TF TaxID=1232410 RepID=UPI0004894242|nr:putative quinol monooxygenase [Desulfuromonas sp. TF]